MPSKQKEKFSPIITSPTIFTLKMPEDDMMLEGNERREKSLVRSTTFFIDMGSEERRRHSLPSARLNPIDRQTRLRNRVKNQKVNNSIKKKTHELPPLLKPANHVSESIVLPPVEYKRWLKNFRRHSVQLTPVKPLHHVRCSTAIVRRKGKSSEEQTNLFTLSSEPDQLLKRIDDLNNKDQTVNNRNSFSSIFSLQTGKNTEEPFNRVFDLKALDEALTKPRNKIAPLNRQQARI